MERVKQEWRETNPEGTMMELAEEVNRRLDEVLSKRWAIGFKDRGMGHGDFGVIVEETGDLVVECGWRECAEHIVKIHNLHLPPEEEKSPFPDDETLRLFVLDEGNPETRIPVFTNDPRHIRSDVGNEDHGGMPYEDFERVCDHAEIKQILALEDLPHDLRGSYPYVGGTIDGGLEYCCSELCALMDDKGVITLP